MPTNNTADELNRSHTTRNSLPIKNVSTVVSSDIPADSCPNSPSDDAKPAAKGKSKKSKEDSDDDDAFGVK